MQGESNASMQEPRHDLFDPTVAARHEYLGDFEEIRGGCSLLNEGSEYTLPALLLPDVVLMPGSTLPMILSEPEEISVLNMALHEPLPTTRLIVVVCYRPRRSPNEALADLVGCTAEIRQIHRQQDNGTVCIMAKGRQRVLRLGQGESGATRPWDPTASRHCMRVRVLPEGEVATVPKVISQGLTHVPTWATRSFDPLWLVDRAKSLCASALPAALSHMNQVRGALELSYWLASNLPLGVESRLTLLQSHCSSDRLLKELRMLQSLGSVRCKVCLAQLAQGQGALKMTEEGVGGAFVNAHGYIHDMATFEAISPGSVLYQGRPETEHSWFPGYSWYICNCSTCFQHLGWRFDAVRPGLRPERFWGLRRPALASGINQIYESGVGIDRGHGSEDGGEEDGVEEDGSEDAVEEDGSERELLSDSLTSDADEAPEERIADLAAE